MINHCFYLNLEKRTDRKEHIEKELNKSSILKNVYQRFSAVDGSKVHPRSVPEGLLTQNALEDILMDTVSAWGLSMTQGALGVLLTYKNLFEKISNLETFAITFEDDVELKENFDENLKIIINDLPKNFDLCYLGYGDINLKKEEYTKSVSIPNGIVTCLPALLVSPTGAKKIVEKLKNIDNQIDTAICGFHKELNVYVANNKLVEIKNQMSSDIQGNLNCIKNYKKQNYIIATLAHGEDANLNASKLAKDLKYFDQKLLIVTNMKGYFSLLDNVIEVPYADDKFSYNKKLTCFEEGFNHADAVVYIDSDSRVFYEKFKNTYTNFLINIEPGFHPSWCWGHVGDLFFTSKDVQGRAKGYGELALSICKEMNIDHTKSKHYQEGILVLSKEDGKEKVLLETWKLLAKKLDDYEEKSGIKRLGVGEGNLFGLSLTKSEMTVKGPEVCNLLGESLKYNFWGIYVNDYIKNFPNRKLVITSGEIIDQKSIKVQFKDKTVDLSFTIVKENSDLLALVFNWNKNNSIEFLDHEFKIKDTIYHFNSEKTNEFNFKYEDDLVIEHTYDWYGEKNWTTLYKFEKNKETE